MSVALPTIAGAPCHDRLRPLCEEDLEPVLAWRNAPEVRAVMYTSREILPAEHAAWFERLQRDPTKRTYVFEADGVPMGIVNFTRMDAVGGDAHWGFYVRPGAPKGYGTRLGRLALAQAFGPLSLNKLIGEVLASNDASHRFHLKLGFEREHNLHAHHRDGDVVHDVHIFSLTRASWLRGATVGECARPAAGES
jgi:UDP-4-amino-4,6-dideoxy-N-acetyl-beta-L-altrosamine N-acetyltransferase